MNINAHANYYISMIKKLRVNIFFYSLSIKKYNENNENKVIGQ